MYFIKSFHEGLLINKKVPIRCRIRTYSLSLFFILQITVIILWSVNLFVNIKF